MLQWAEGMHDAKAGRVVSLETAIGAREKGVRESKRGKKTS